MKTPRTISEAFDAVVRLHWSQPRFLKSRRLDDVQGLFKRIAPDFGAVYLADLTAPQVMKWHRYQIDSPTAANRALEVLSRIYSFANENGWCENNPCKFIRSFPEKKRRRFATPDEIKQIGAILKRDLKIKKYRRGAVFLLALLYTGARPKSLLDAHWNELKLRSDGCVIYDFAGKGSADSGEEETVIFPRQLMAELLKLPHKDADKVFHPSNWRIEWKRIQKEIGAEDLWARDLRRTFATVGLSSGISIDAIGATLNHRSDSTTKIYARLFDETKVETTTKIASQLDALIG